MIKLVLKTGQKGIKRWPIPQGLSNEFHQARQGSLVALGSNHSSQKASSLFLKRAEMVKEGSIKKKEKYYNRRLFDHC